MMTFFDETSKTVYNKLAKTNSFVCSCVMLNIERFEIGSRYVTAKVQTGMERMSLLTYRAVGQQ
jgi:hypothetical protein